MATHSLLWCLSQLLHLLKSSLKFWDLVDSAVNALEEAAGDETKEERKARRRLVSGSHSTQFASRLIFELFIYKLQRTAKQHAAI